jgi:chromosome segregation ATPase
MQELIQ